MQKTLLILVILYSIFPITTIAAEEQHTSKAGFTRDGNLWLLISNEEIQITNSGKVVGQPKWSEDGDRLLYQLEAPSEFQQNEGQMEIWAYNIKTQEHKKIFYDGHSPTWSPKKNMITFKNNQILNISDLKQFYNVAAGVDSYTWLPNGKGFLLSSSGVLEPDGWTSAKLYKKMLTENYDDVPLFGDIEPFFTLPKEVGFNNHQVIAVNAGNFQYSPSTKWISFIVSPTASWSMDSNMLCVITSDGKNFEVLNEVIFGVGLPKWAPSTDTIAYIAGGGRIVFGFKNKDIKTREMPVSRTYTPPNCADLDFTWITDETIVTSRVPEKDWSNDFSKHPLPSLYKINTKTNKQTKITTTPEGYGDYEPQYIASIDKLIWFRGTSITDQNRNVWRSNKDGRNSELWLSNVRAIEFYQH